MPSAPIRAEELSGLYVLLMVIPLDSTRDVYFFVGTAVWDRRSIYLINDEEERLVRIPVSAAALVGSDPSTLTNILRPRVLQQLAPDIAEIDTYVAVFAESAPVGASPHRNAFFGLASGPNGEVLLMQGDPLWAIDD